MGVIARVILNVPFRLVCISLSQYVQYSSMISVMGIAVGFGFMPAQLKTWFMINFSGIISSMLCNRYKLWNH